MRLNEINEVQRLQADLQKEKDDKLSKKKKEREEARKVIVMNEQEKV